MTTPGPWHYEGHYILTDSEPQVVIAERVSEANRGLIASAPALADALEKALKKLGGTNIMGEELNAALNAEIRAALKAAGRIP